MVLIRWSMTSLIVWRRSALRADQIPAVARVARNTGASWGWMVVIFLAGLRRSAV